MSRLFIHLFILIIIVSSCKNQEKSPSAMSIKERGTLTEDGAWCWFSDPRAIYRKNGEPEIVSGWVTLDGSIESAIFNFENGEITTQNVHPQLEVDDHANPSFLELANHDILMFYAKHMDQNLRMNRLDAGSNTFGEEILYDPFSESELKKYPRAPRVTYANPFTLEEENGRIYCFGRWIGFKPNVCWSDDNGKTFTKSKVFITNFPFDAGNRPYMKYYSDGKSRIHIVMTDGHPRNEPTNSVYYAYYENGAFWKADHTKICSMEDAPFEPKQATRVYQGTEERGRAWVYDIAADEKGNPVILYARYPEETDHIYHYARYDGNKWIDQEICHAGKWFPQTQEGKIEREPHYSGGMTIDPSNPNQIFVSREINGVFEIEKRTTADVGKTWEVIPITENSTFDNVRPYIPRNGTGQDPLVLLWMVNEKYVHFTDYKTSISYYLEK